MIAGWNSGRWGQDDGGRTMVAGRWGQDDGGRTMGAGDSIDCRYCRIDSYKELPLGKLATCFVVLLGSSVFGALAIADYLLDFRWMLFVGVSLVIAGLGLLAFAGWYEWFSYYRKKHWIFQEGSVTGQVKSFESCYPKICYTVDGEEREFVSRYDNVQVKIGRKSCVYYCPSCFMAEEAPPQGRLYYSIFAGLFGVLLVFFGTLVFV